LLSLSLCLDLGIVNVAIVRTALQRGGRAGLAVGAGSCFGDLFYFGAALLGVATLLAWPPFRWALWLGGTAILIGLSVKMVREVVRPRALDFDGPADPRPALRLFGWGFSLSLASPTAILWFAVVGGSVIAELGGTRADLIPFAAGFFAAGLAWSAGLAAAAATLRHVGGRRLSRALAFASALLFIYFAVMVFVRGLADVRAAH
jgi:L-lysine exporter family protein LysE/ArgO